VRRSQEKRGPSGERFCSLGPPQPTAALYRIVEDSVEIYASSNASEERAFASHLAQKARRVRRTCNEPHWGAAVPGNADVHNGYSSLGVFFMLQIPTLH